MITKYLNIYYYNYFFQLKIFFQKKINTSTLSIQKVFFSKSVFPLGNNNFQFTLFPSTDKFDKYTYKINQILSKKKQLQI